jgi:hypothetical protein
MIDEKRFKERSMETSSRNDPQKEVQGKIHEKRFKERSMETISRNNVET